MFDSDLPFPQAIPALAGCYEAAAASTFPYVIRFCRGHGDCCAIAILFWPARSPIAAPQFFLPARSPIAAPYLLAGAIRRLPGRNFSFGRRDP